MRLQQKRPDSRSGLSQNLIGDEVRLPDLRAIWQWLAIGGMAVIAACWKRIVAFLKSMFELDEARLKRAEARVRLSNAELENAERKLTDTKKAVRLEVLKRLLAYPIIEVTDLCQETGATLELLLEMHAAEELYLSNGGWCMREKPRNRR